jgi:hypothetical protein
LRQQLTAALEEYLARDRRREHRRANTTSAARPVGLYELAGRDAPPASHHTPAWSVSMSYARGRRQIREQNGERPSRQRTPQRTP